MSVSPEFRWAVLEAKLPPDPAAYVAAIESLAGQGEDAAAGLGLAAAEKLFADDAGIARLVAEQAGRRGDWPASIAAWQRVCTAGPADLDAAGRLAAACLHADLPAEAEAVLAGALVDADAADPAVRALLVLQARAAAARGDFGTAKARFISLQAQAPDDPAVREGLRDLEGLRLPELREPAVVAGKTVEAAHTELMLRFESIGGTCEFGLLQRHFGAEPLGLFRWIGINLVNLCAALDSDLAGIGEAEYTRLEVTSVGEFSTSDSRYGLNMHTFMRDSGQDRDKLLLQLQRRMRFLRGKLLEDLREGEKIFVYRHLLHPPERQFRKLVTALQRYNPANRLVIIKMLEHGAPGEDLRPYAPGVAIGAIANGRRPVKGTGWAIDNDFWLKTCQKAIRMLP